MAKNTLTDKDRKELQEWLQELDTLTEQEPEDLTYLMQPGDLERVEKYFLDGEGNPPANADRFAVKEGVFLDRDGEKRPHKYVIDTVWEDWNQKCIDLNEKYHDVIMKALAVQLAKTDLSENAGDVSDLVRSLLEQNPPPEDFFNMPDSQMTSLILDVLTYGEELPQLPGKKKSVSHGIKNEVSLSQKGDAVRVSRESRTSEISAEVSDIMKLIGDNDAAINLFVLSLIEANKQALSPAGELKQDHVSFPLQELVDLGMYKTVRSARNGFNAGADVLTSIKIKGHESRRKGKEVTTADVVEVLFTGARIKNGQCYLYLNDRINWEVIASAYTVIPRYYFTLPTRRSKTLLLYIFSLARQRTKEIATKGYFTIRFRAIQAALNLPSEKGNPNPRRDTIGAIEAAVEKIEDENHEYFHNADMQLQPVYDDAAPVSDSMDNGYLKVTLKGQYAERFIEVSKTTAAKVEKSQKRQEQIVDKAKAAALEKKMTTHNENDTQKTTSSTGRK